MPHVQASGVTKRCCTVHYAQEASNIDNTVEIKANRRDGKVCQAELLNHKEGVKGRGDFKMLSVQTKERLLTFPEGSTQKVLLKAVDSLAIH